MGSHQRIRGHRLLARFCYGACFGFGFVITAVTLTAMFWIVWCYFGLTSVPLSETQRRALVDYSFTSAQQLATSSPTFPPELPETSVNQISKFATTSTNLDKRKELNNERVLNITKNLAGREQINKTLEYNIAANKTVGNEQSIFSSKDFSKDDAISSETSVAPNLEEKHQFSKEENRNSGLEVGRELQNNDNRKIFLNQSTNPENGRTRKIILNADGEGKTYPQRSSNFDPNDMHIKNERDSRRTYETSDLPIRDGIDGNFDKLPTDDGVASSKLDLSQNIPSQLSNKDGYDNRNLDNVTYYGLNMQRKNETVHDDKFGKDGSYEDTTPLSDSLRNEKHDFSLRDRTNEPTFDNTRTSNRRQYTRTRNNQRDDRENIKPHVFDDGRYYEARSGDDRRLPEYVPSRKESFERRPPEYDRDSGRFYETTIRDDSRISQVVPPREERFERRRTEYDRDSDQHYYDNERRNNERQVSYDRRFRDDRYTDRMPQGSHSRIFPDEINGSDDHIYEDKQFQEERYRNRRIDEEEKYKNRRINDKDQRRQMYPEDEYRDKAREDRDRYLKDDRYRDRDFITSETGRRRNTDIYQTRNKEYYDEEGKFYERRDELHPQLDRQRTYSTRYDERLIDVPRERTIHRDSILSSRSDYRPTSDIMSPRRDVYNTRYDSRSIDRDRSINRDYPQINQDDRVSETRKPLIVEDRYRSEYIYEKDDRPTRYNDRDRISPTRVIDSSYNSRSQNDEVYDSRRSYQDNIRRENFPILRNTRYDDDEHDRTPTRYDSSRNSDNERRYYRQRPPQEDRGTIIGDGKEVTLDRRSYSSEDEEIARIDRARPTYVRDRDYEIDNSRRRYRTHEVRKEYPDEVEDYRQSKSTNYGKSDTENRDSYIRNKSEGYNGHSNSDMDYIPRHMDYIPQIPDKYNRNRDVDVTLDSNRDKYEGSKLDDRYKNRNYDSFSNSDKNDRRINSEIINRRQEERTLPSYDQSDKHFQGNLNFSSFSNNNKDTFPRINEHQDNINLNFKTNVDDDLTSEPRQENNNGGRENVGDRGRQAGTNLSDFDSDQPMSAKDVIEAALRHSDTSDSNTREVFYPVFDPRVSNLTSSDIIKPSERRGTTINSKKRKK